MNINKYNSEGYHDPTPYEALLEIERAAQKTGYKPLVYICSPFAGDVKRNIERARGYSRFAVTKGAIPIAPHLLFPQFLDDSDQEERKLGLFMGIVLLGKSKELWCFGRKHSSGMKIELEKAKQKNIKVRYFDEKCLEVEPW